MSLEVSEEGQITALPDRRQLGYLIVGQGKPVFFFPGSPGSQFMVLWLKEMAKAHHLQIIGGIGRDLGCPHWLLNDDFGTLRTMSRFLWTSLAVTSSH